MATRSATPARFDGFPLELFSFLEGLEEDNSREYWEAHKSTWKEIIQPAVENLMRDLEPRFGALRTFRPNRDVRFSRDKTPYKTWIGVTTTNRAVGGVGSFMRIDAAGMAVAVGAMAFAPDQVKKFRDAIDEERSAAEFCTICRDLDAHQLPVGPGAQPPLQRPPAGFPPDHPRIDLLRWKGAVVIKEYARADWLTTAEAFDRIVDVWSTAAPLAQWIDEFVGESSTPSGRPR